ncbi:MAG: IS3 family transposase [Eubacteriales bacterium]|nr:IS3 family transposase [Eubacteriales bacterium]
MVYRFIDNNKHYFGLRWLCRKFNLSPNGYYNYLKNTKGKYKKQLEVIYERIKYIFYNNNKTVGHGSMRVFLSRYGIFLSKTTIHKYMNKTLNLTAIIMRRKAGYTSGKKHKILNNLLKQNFTVYEKNKVWCTDFTYMQSPNGKFRYNCTIIDLFDRSVVASMNSDNINTDLAKDTLKEALKQEKYPKNLILHSDQGHQFDLWEFIIVCKKFGITQSMSKAGCPYDNGPMERYYLLKIVFIIDGLLKM